MWKLHYKVRKNLINYENEKKKKNPTVWNSKRTWGPSVGILRWKVTVKYGYGATLAKCVKTKIMERDE